VTGACRNVKFSPNSSFDLLAFSEVSSFFLFFFPFFLYFLSFYHFLKKSTAHLLCPPSWYKNFYWSTNFKSLNSHTRYWSKTRNFWDLFFSWCKNFLCWYYFLSFIFLIYFFFFFFFFLKSSFFFSFFLFLRNINYG